MNKKIISTENYKLASVLHKMKSLCSRQEKSCFDIRQKLLKQKISSNDQDEIIHILLEEGFINELRFANAYVHDKFRINRWGRVKIAHQLKCKKIPPGVIFEALQQIDEDEYMQSLQKTLQLKMKTEKRENCTKAKLFRFIKARGFEPNISLSMIDELLLE